MEGSLTLPVLADVKAAIEQCEKAKVDPKNELLVESKDHELLEWLAAGAEKAEQLAQAEANMKDALGGDDIEHVETAVRTLEAQAPDHPLVAAGKKKEAALRKRKEAMDNLVSVLADTAEDTGPLDKAIAAAKAAGVHDVTIMKAEEHRANLAKIMETRKKMTEAGKSGDVGKLEAAIAEGRAVLSEEDMKVFDDMLAAFKDRDKAIAELASAVKSKDIEELKVAIAMGEQCGVDVSEA